MLLNCLPQVHLVPPGSVQWQRPVRPHNVQEAVPVRWDWGWSKSCFTFYHSHCILCFSPYSCSFKEELHNRFNLISEERVKNFKHNSENLMKIGWKIRKLWHFEVSQIFKKHFLTSQYEYANEWGDDVIASQFSIHFVHRNDKKFIFQLWKC